MSSHPETTVLWEKKLAANPRSLVFSRLADSYRKKGDVQRAIDICVEGLENNPRYVTGRIILARCYLEQENFQNAIEEFRKVCKYDRHNQIAIKMLADVFAKQSMEDKAGDLYALLRKMDPENSSLSHLSRVYQP
ncbi:MAG: tetratricopeptide repeat protein, partial [Chitinivibrionales bacterium]|nr:tetratricopeptide repeat protein [Chitinivibrionales bacterium]MBD3358222.1 tetratricopeptide repeat protein [Chitinivibrionales bacterium]